GKRELSVDIHPLMFEDMHMESNLYDLVVSYHTIEHIPSPSVIFQKIARILKPSGVVCIEVPIGEEEYGNQDHLHFFSEKSLKLLLENFFSETRIVENRFTNADGIIIASLYGIGRYPVRKD
ncbi:MAG: class I SAM-dependent methyltransferase, partial [Syntrophobacteraceae bacterium]